MLLVGVPHPNEPIGTLTHRRSSARLLCEDDELRDAARRHVFAMPVADPDGLVLNEGWFKGAFSPLRYALKFYRPPHREQVEWSFPVDYKTLHFTTPAPETAHRDARHGARPTALLLLAAQRRLLRRLLLRLARPARRSFRALHELVAAQGLPLHRGEPEVPYLKTLAPAVYELFSIEDTYDYLARTLDEDPAAIIEAGTSADDWLKRVCDDPFSLVCELPYYTAPALEDTSPAEHQPPRGRPRRDVARARPARGDARRASRPSPHGCPITA